MNVTQYKRMILATRQVETLDFSVHQGANIDGQAGVSRLRALELVNQWNASAHLNMAPLNLVYWLER